MGNDSHKFHLTLKVDGKTVATREEIFTEYNNNVIYSLKIYELMKDMCYMIAESLRDSSVKMAYKIYGNR